MAITNPQLQHYQFLEAMARDPYFPAHLVEAGRQIFIALCETIEAQRPAKDAEIYALTHAATEEFNILNEAFLAAGSEIETVARDAIAADFEHIVKAYGFDLDIEEVIEPRDW